MVVAFRRHTLPLSMRYRSCRNDDAELRSKPRELAQRRRRSGYRRLHIRALLESKQLNLYEVDANVPTQRCSST